MAFELTWGNRGVYKRFTGFLSFDEYARSQQLTLGDHRSDDLLYVINDLREVEGYSGTPEQAEYLGAFSYGASRSNPRIRVAYITSNPGIISLVSVASVFSSYPLRCFSTPEAAMAWATQQPVAEIRPQY